MARSKFDEFCRAAFEFLDGANVRSLVVGGLAVVAIGEPRTTADADAVVFLTPEAAKKLLQRAKEKGFEFELPMELERIETTGTMRMRRGRFHLDLILASLPFEEEAYRRSIRKKLFGRFVRFPTPEDLILFKVLAGREKDLLDAEGVVRRHERTLDCEYLERTLRPICDLAEDMTPWSRLQKVLKGRSRSQGPESS